MPARASHNQTRTGHQRPEELPDRNVEAEWSLLQDAVDGSQLILLLHPDEPINDTAMRVDDTLRTTGRARGVDHVGSVVGFNRNLRVRSALLRHDLPLLIEIDRLKGVSILSQRSKCLFQVRLGEQDFDTGIGEHEGKTLLRVRRIERNVSRSRFDDRQQGDHHLGGTLHEHADERFLACAKAAQMMRELIGAICSVRDKSSQNKANRTSQEEGLAPGL